MPEIVKTVGFFVLAAICEMAGAYMIWQWQRNNQPVWIALLGLAALFAYSFIQTLQAFGFGRTFAAYGGIFILTALIWGWLVDHQVPDRWDWIGAAICLVGVTVILAAPRT